MQEKNKNAKYDSKPFLHRVLLFIMLATEYSTEAAAHWFATYRGKAKKNRYLDKSVVTPTYVMLLFNSLSDEDLHSLIHATQPGDERAKGIADKFVLKWKAYKAVQEANVDKGIACTSEDTLAHLRGFFAPQGLMDAAGDTEASNASVHWPAGRMRLHRFRKEFGMSYGKLPPREPLKLEHLRTKVAANSAVVGSQNQHPGITQNTFW